MFKFIKKLFFLIILFIILFFSYLAYTGYDMYKKAMDETSLSDRIAEIQSKENYTKYDDISKMFLNAIVSVEDHRFFEHYGVDLISVTRAILINIKDGELEQGGSTITQQLAKNICFSQEKKINRKIAEIFVVHDLEKKYSKEEILELYVNTIYFGKGYYGIGNASLGFYNKTPAELTDYESTFLAGIVNAPSIYSSEKHSDSAAKRHKWVLNKMVENNMISNEEAKKILDGNN